MKNMPVFILLSCALFFSTAGAEAPVDTIHFSIGMKYFGEKQYDKAVEEFRKMLTIYPDHAPSYRQIALAWRAQGKHALAVYNLKKASKYAPGNAQVLRDLAEAYFSNGETEPAMNALRQAITAETDPSRKAKDEERVRAMLGEYKKAEAKADSTPVPAAAKVDTAAKDGAAQAVAQTGKGAESGKAGEAPEEAPGAPEAASGGKHADLSADPLMKPVLDAYNAGNYTAGLNACRDLLKKKPGHAGAYYYAGVMRYAAKDMDKALFNFNKAFSYPEKGFNAHYYLGLIHERQGRAPEAIKEYEQYINLTSYEAGKAEAKARLSRLLKQPVSAGPETTVSGGMLPQAGQAAPDGKVSAFRFNVSGNFSFIIEDTLSEPGRKMLKSLDLFLDEKYDASLKGLKELYREHPRHLLADNALYNIGLVYSRMRLFGEAQEYLGKAVRDYPGGDVARPAEALYGEVFAQKGARDSAVAAFERYLKRYPKDLFYPFINGRLGDLAFDQNDGKEALKYYLKALGQETDPEKKISLYFKTGECYWRQGSDRGIDYFLQAVSADSSIRSGPVMESCFRLGDYYFRLKNLESALKYYKMAVARFPKSANTAWAQYQIGNIYKAGRQYEDAIRAYQGLMDTHPDDYWAQQAKWKKEDAVWENEYREILK